MFSVEIDEKEIEEIFLAELRKRIDQLEHAKTFWDMKTLCTKTCLSENTIKDRFFYDSRFPKFRVGGKWLMPAKECEEFLLNWIREQPSN